jgi:hypothetical protein
VKFWGELKVEFDDNPAGNYLKIVFKSLGLSFLQSFSIFLHRIQGSTIEIPYQVLDFLFRI